LLSNVGDQVHIVSGVTLRAHSPHTNVQLGINATCLTDMMLPHAESPRYVSKKHDLSHHESSYAPGTLPTLSRAALPPPLPSSVPPLSPSYENYSSYTNLIHWQRCGRCALNTMGTHELIPTHTLIHAMRHTVRHAGAVQNRQ
jgi:hypothetical protein